MSAHLEELPPEPGTVPDCSLGIPGDPEPRPEFEPDEPTEVNDDEDEEDDDDGDGGEA